MDLAARNDCPLIRDSYCGKIYANLKKSSSFFSLSFVCLMINTPINKFHKHQVEFCVILYVSQRLEMRTITTLTHLFPVHPFSTP